MFLIFVTLVIYKIKNSKHDKTYGICMLLQVFVVFFKNKFLAASQTLSLLQWAGKF